MSPEPEARGCVGSNVSLCASRTAQHLKRNPQGIKSSPSSQCAKAALKYGPFAYADDCRSDDLKGRTLAPEQTAAHFQTIKLSLHRWNARPASASLRHLQSQLSRVEPIPSHAYSEFAASCPRHRSRQREHSRNVLPRAEARLLQVAAKCK